MPDIRLIDVRKTYSNRAVGLHATTLHVPDGTYFVLLGPSGSGKSTLLRLVAGLESPDGGTIYFGDRVVQALPPRERGIAFVPQRSALYPDRDVAGNIRAGLEYRTGVSAKEIETRVREAAAMLQIVGLLGNRPHELSGGEQRRVMLARALVRRADVWLLDEPLGQLDSALAGKLSQDLHLLQRHFRLTIIHVTHDPIEALALADRVGLLGGGKLLQTGQPEEVYSRPGSRTVGLHFGRPPMNVIDGSGDGSRFASADGWLQVPCPVKGDVTLGVRPADVAFGPGDGLTLVGTGTAGEPRRVDDRFLVSVRGPATEIRGLTDQPPMAGRLDVWLRMDRLHWFDQRTSERVG
jgi:ABC-type sugar transport system ATPase subunit